MLKHFELTNYFNKKRNLLLSFFFPLWPIKLFSNIKSMMTLCLLISLRFVMQFASIYIPSINMSISLAWTPIIVASWIFGPIVGFFTGAITDTIGFFIKPSVWFWLYAIQEPLVCFLSGIFGSLFQIFSKKPSNIKKSFLFFQSIVIVFTTTCIVSLIFMINGYSYEGKKSNIESFFIENSKWIILGSILFFFLVIEIMSFFILRKKRKDKIAFFYVASLSCLISLIFSFLLGPISANEYYKYLHNGLSSPNFIKYGTIFYLIPRAMKESIKTPIQIMLLISIIPICNKTINEIKINIRTKWNYKIKK